MKICVNCGVRLRIRTDSAPAAEPDANQPGRTGILIISHTIMPQISSRHLRTQPREVIQNWLPRRISIR